MKKKKEIEIVPWFEEKVPEPTYSTVGNISSINVEVTYILQEIIIYEKEDHLIFILCIHHINSSSNFIKKKETWIHFDL